jgi:hypothetical protein
MTTKKSARLDSATRDRLVGLARAYQLSDYSDACIPSAADLALMQLETRRVDGDDSEYDKLARNSRGIFVAGTFLRALERERKCPHGVAKMRADRAAATKVLE